jgi:hypothetical protein
MVLDLRRKRCFSLLKSTLISVLLIALITFLMIIFSEKEKEVEGWPIGLTSCPTPSCDHQ